MVPVEVGVNRLSRYGHHHSLGTPAGHPLPRLQCRSALPAANTDPPVLTRAAGRVTSG